MRNKLFGNCTARQWHLRPMTYGLLPAPSLTGRIALLMNWLVKPPESRAFASRRHGTGWTAQRSTGDGFSISNAKYLSLLQWHSIAEPASGMTKYFISFSTTLTLR